MTGPFVPVAMLNLIRAVLGIHHHRFNLSVKRSRRALEIDEKVLGPEHPEVAVRLNVLALLYKDQGREAEAEPLFKRALAISDKALGPEHPITKLIRADMRPNGPPSNARPEIPK